MAIWASANLQDKGIDYLRTATFLDLVKNYTPGDSLATVAANTIAETARIAGNYALSTPTAGIRRVTSAAQLAVPVTGSSTLADDPHFVFRTASEVIYAVEEGTPGGRVFISGDDLDIPAIWLETPQPTIVP